MAAEASGQASETRRQLGHSGLEIGPLMLGGNVFGWTVDEAMSFRLLDAFVASGLNAIDTANVYSRWIPGNQGGESETILGNWFAQSGKRDSVVLATKVGMETPPDPAGLKAETIIAAAENSLRRLQTDRIDLYQSHKDDGTPQDETLRAYETLIRQGKVRAIGASNFTAERLRESIEVSQMLGIPGYHALQPEYNLYDRAKYEAELEPLCREHAIGVIPYYALASGFLTGKYRSEADLGQSPRGAKAKNYLNPKGHAILGALDDVAERLGSTPGRVAIAWLIARPSITAPIASATTLEQMNDLIAATHLTLDGEALNQLNTVSAWS